MPRNSAEQVGTALDVETLQFLLARRGDIAAQTVEHLLLVAVSLAIAAGIGVPLGIALTRKPSLASGVMGFANVIQTVPSLALFGFLIPIPLIGGIGDTTAVVALALYGLLPILRNTYTGIQSVDPSVVEAGRGMGMTDFQRLRLVEVPLALPTILAGVRIAAVVGVGLATIAAAVGAGGLGNSIFRGLAMVDNRLILAGALPAAALAIAADGLLGWLERRLQK
jgi:osmoprotectant transport system permease protein